MQSTASKMIKIDWQLLLKIRLIICIGNHWAIDNGLIFLGQLLLCVDTGYTSVDD